MGLALGEGAATDGREVIRIGIIARLRIAITVLDQQPTLFFAKASGPNERKQTLECVPGVPRTSLKFKPIASAISSRVRRRT